MTDAHTQSGTEAEAAESKSSKRRRLTAEQLAHKRELDRRAQRNNREKTRSRIAHLESIVEALQDRDHDKLVVQIDDQKTEIERLKGLLSGVANIVKGIDSAASSQNGKSEYVEHVNGDNEDAPKCTKRLCKSPVKVEDDDTSMVETPQQSQQDDSNNGAEVAAAAKSPVDTTTMQLVNQSQIQHESITQMATSIFGNTDLDGRMWYVCGVILRYILATTTPAQIDYAHDEDIAIRAVFEGWSSVVEKYPLDRGWQWLKEVDERIYFHRWAPFRLMHLRNCRLIFLRQMMLGHTKGAKGLPNFFAPRPAEENIEHDPLVEYFPWPGLRERMLFRPTMFATNKFMDNLRCEIDFSWGSDPHQLYTLDPTTKTYTYSDWFHSRIIDLRCYPGTVDFFESFPELKADIPMKDGTSLTRLRLGYRDEEEKVAAERARRESRATDWGFSD
ncbi:uncharacterized protein AB675_11814 [Cyphellophora attinorum]|uniref:BZIP domain-containing protein n=1 Tax=Cyphellophora attinorum TaxID=1664694 RepID=A0A0N1NWH0_9EURO|nr:uncharacterized protein AB675_11814 [Phialophora attinorum]KPI36757.1 hypothetical protein AB675_11814 [Phialophora attinorum]